MDYPKSWRLDPRRRGRPAMGVRAHLPNADEVFLAALLQDIAELAIDRVQSLFYAELKATATHRELVDHENSRMALIMLNSARGS